MPVLFYSKSFSPFEYHTRKRSTIISFLFEGYFLLFMFSLQPIGMIVDTENLEIDVSLSEGIIGKVHERQRLSVGIPSLRYKTIGYGHAIIPNQK